MVVVVDIDPTHPAETQHQCKNALGTGALSEQFIITKLPAIKNQALLVRWNALLFLDLGLDALNGVAAVHVQGDGLTRERRGIDSPNTIPCRMPLPLSPGEVESEGGVGSQGWEGSVRQQPRGKEDPAAWIIRLALSQQGFNNVAHCAMQTHGKLEGALYSRHTLHESNSLGVCHGPAQPAALCSSGHDRGQPMK